MNHNKNNYITKKTLTLMLSVTLVFGMVFGPVPIIGAETADAKSLDGEKVAAVSSPEEVAKFIEEGDSEDSFNTAVVDVNSGTVTIDGKYTNPDNLIEGLSEVLTKPSDSEDESPRVEEVLSLVDEDAYDVNVSGEQIEIGSPYQSKRIILNGSNLKDSYGAVSAIYDSSFGRYILCYNSPEETQRAYSELAKAYDCYVDIILDQDLVEKESWGKTYMGFDQALNKGIVGAGHSIKVAVVDTGCSTWHSTFNNRISEESYDFVQGNNSVADNLGHGTNVAGIIAECTPSNTQLMILNVFGDKKTTSLSRIENALIYAYEHKADVINLSLGIAADYNGDGIVSSAEKSNYDSMCKSMTSLLKRIQDNNVVMVASAGNEHTDVEYCWPANSSYTIAVSSINESGKLSNFSNSGSKIDFCAPGERIREPGKGKNEYTIMSGTSQAAPHVSAAFALFKQGDPNISFEEYYNLAKANAKDLGSPGKDSSFGHGSIYVSKLVTDKQQTTGENLPTTPATPTTSTSPTTVPAAPVVTLTTKNAKLTLSGSSFSYKGTGIRPAVVVTYKGKKLVEGQDYTISYSNNVKVGKSAKATITGKGSFKGSISKKFTIKKASAQMSLKYEKTALKVGEKGDPYVETSSDGKVKFSTSNKKVVTVTSTGVITAKKAGSATISAYVPATKGYNKTATKKIKITVHK